MSGNGNRGRLAVLLALVIAASAFPAAIAGSQGSQGSTRSFIVGFYEMPQDRESYQGEPVTAVDEDLDYLVVETDEPEAFRDRVRQDERARYLEEDHRDHRLAFTPNDPRYPDQYGPQTTETDTAWDVTLGSTSVVVGLLDSGINEDHEDLPSSRVENGYDYVNQDSVPEDAADCSYHGTHVAGIASATTDNGKGVAGMSQHVATMHKIFDGDGSGDCGAATTSAIADALKELGDKGAHVSSNSWTTSVGSSTLNDAIDYAHNKGVIHVASAGNEGPCQDCVEYPWKDRPDKVVVVSCTDENDDFCSFSSQGPEIDVAAPGKGVLSLDGGTVDGYTQLSGTSMSTPHVSGAAALYVDANGDVSHSTMEDELANSADDVGLSSNRQGAGRLNTSALVGDGGGDTNSPPTASFTHACSNLECTFNASDSSDSDGNIASYDWEFGDGTTGSGEVVNHTYAEGGDYTVNLTVTDDDGAQDTETATVSPQEPPTAEFETSCHELNCTLDASASSDADGSIASYEWDFGDGTTGTGEVVDHTYEEAGDYEITLTVTDDDGLQDQTSRTVSVAPNQPPLASFTASCAEGSCQFDGGGSWDSDGSVESYEWDFGDGATASGATVEHVYGDAGDYAVTLTVTDDDGAQDTETKVVSVSGGATHMHVHSIDHEPAGLDLLADVMIYDDEGRPVPEATVEIETCNTVGLCQRGTDTTNGAGEATLVYENGFWGRFTTCVLALEHGSLTYAPIQDHAGDGNCRTQIFLGGFAES